MARELRDGRIDLPIQVHSELDDMGLPSRTFRVYAHLARRAGRDGLAFPSYASIGEVCFRPDMPTAKPDTLRRLAIAAINDLVERGLITKEQRRDKEGDSASNIYRLTARADWQGSAYAPQGGGSAYAPQVVHTHHGSAYAPKGNPVEGNPVEGNPFERDQLTLAADAEKQNPTATAILETFAAYGVNPNGNLDTYLERAASKGLRAVIDGINAAGERDKASVPAYVLSCIDNWTGRPPKRSARSKRINEDSPEARRRKYLPD
jgi:hypothetical protein